MIKAAILVLAVIRVGLSGGEPGTDTITTHYQQVGDCDVDREVVLDRTQGTHVPHVVREAHTHVGGDVLVGPPVFTDIGNGR